jgi:hypothetical protein
MGQHLRFYMKETLDNLVGKEQERRKEDADYFNSYKIMLQELLDEEKEKKETSYPTCLNLQCLRN